MNQREKKLECEVCVPWQCLVVQNVVENVVLSGACAQLCQNSIHLRSPGQVSMSGKTVTMLSERTSGSSFGSASIAVNVSATAGAPSTSRMTTRTFPMRQSVRLTV